ncbi:hypothetical protein CEXT_38341 [Caerostris extrusa]|uniref:Uncharacterized protein n=1 Tax=Caerostris extrusa TaxID=172846 RepID=A0AAV4NU28_CAEEX|nr:hypothetical protein CEXT_38341 [Caerostris extrusa]
MVCSRQNNVCAIKNSEDEELYQDEPKKDFAIRNLVTEFPKCVPVLNARISHSYGATEPFGRKIFTLKWI